MSSPLSQQRAIKIWNFKSHMNKVEFTVLISLGNTQKTLLLQEVKSHPILLTGASLHVTQRTIFHD